MRTSSSAITRASSRRRSTVRSRSVASAGRVYSRTMMIAPTRVAANDNSPKPRRAKSAKVTPLPRAAGGGWMKYDAWSATKSHSTAEALHSTMRCSVNPMVSRAGICRKSGILGASCRTAMEFAPRVSTSRKTKNSSRGGKDQSGSHDVSRSVLQRMIGSALPSRAKRTRISGSDRAVPLIKAREREEDV